MRIGEISCKRLPSYIRHYCVFLRSEDRMANAKVLGLLREEETGSGESPRSSEKASLTKQTSSWVCQTWEPIRGKQSKMLSNSNPGPGHQPLLGKDFDAFGQNVNSENSERNYRKTSKLLTLEFPSIYTLSMTLLIIVLWLINIVSYFLLVMRWFCTPPPPTTYIWCFWFIKCWEVFDLCLYTRCEW